MKIFLAVLLFTLSANAQGIGGKAGIGGNAGIGGGAVVTTSATFISSANCTMIAVASCTMSGLSLASGTLITVGNAVISGGAGNTVAVSDSNGDSPSCTTAYEETTDALYLQGCILKAGATITSITCTQSGSTNDSGCVAAWYSPGSLAGTIDKSIGSDNANVSVWTTTATATLTSSNELVVVFWLNGGAGNTSTYSDGGTQRTIQSISTFDTMALEDRNVSATTAVTGSGTWSITTYGVAVIMTIK